MRRMMIGALLLLAAAAASGCSAGSGAAPEPAPEPARYEAPGMEGYVVKKESGRVLVVDPVPQNFSASGGVTEFYNAIWFSGAPAHAEVGRKVQVWFDEVAESYPGQSKATRMNVLTSAKPAAADLSEAEAIRRALASGEAWNVPAVQNAEYEAPADAWHILIREADREESVRLEDRQ